ncbi:MAG: hypothetical protein AAB554_05840 [Patescibacteria group bacterium]
MKNFLKFLVLGLFVASSVASSPFSAAAAVPTVPSGYEMVDIITNTGFEDASAPLGFAPAYPQDGAVSRTTTNPISGFASLKVDLNAYGRVSLWKDYPWDGGPLADSVSFSAKVRVDAASASDRKLQVCSIAYFQTGNPRSTCQDYPVSPSSVVEVFLTTDTDGLRLDYTFPQFKLDDGGTLTATVDDAHFYVVQPGASTPPPPSCSADTWNCTSYGACSLSGTQTRTCTMTDDCASVTTPSPATTQSCTPPTVCTADAWSCTAFSACSASGTQTRTCTMTDDCPGVSTPSPATAQSCTPPTTAPPSTTYPSGTLIKRGDHPAVYYLAADGKRYVFPNERTFRTWYADFSGVQTVTASEMAAIAIGGNVTYRPGSRMIKIDTDPKVYAVSRGGILRPLASEAVAASLYGSAWATTIDDIPDAFFVNYAMGAAVNSSSDYNVQSELNSAPSINADKNLGAGTGTPPPSCTADTWTCTTYGTCSASGTQTRTCTMTDDCPGVSTPSPATSQSCTPPTTPPPIPPPGSVYPGYTYHLPSNRPYIALTDFSASSPGYASFKSFVDQAVSGNAGYGYTPSDAVVMYALTGQENYITSAIRDVDAMVAEAEADIAAGRNPELAGDSYLEVGDYIEEIAFAYDRGYDRLTASQRTRWAALAERAVANVWDNEHAVWGTRSAPWSGWSVDDPGNNYFYSFIKATQLWALASKSTTWIDFLQDNKWPQLADYYAQIPGGGSREGTGYGTAHKNLFEDYRMWKASTGEDLSRLSSHAKDTIDFWVHATVPTRDRFAPIGDQSRVSHPDLYDYQENLVREAVVLNPGTEQARRGLWWIANNSVASLSGFNRRPSLMTTSDTATAPTSLEYFSQGTGNLFARSSWATDASWMSFHAGPYDQSHAHQDQGSFTFFKNGWLSVTNNIWSHSGIHQETGNHNVLRFVKGGADIGQNESTSTMTYARTGVAIDIHATLTPAYSRNSADVRAWTRDVHYEGSIMRVHDVCDVGTGVTPIFQVQVPVQPATQADGSVKAGNLKIVPGAGTSVRFVSMTSVDSDFNSGWRVEITKPTCDFTVEMTAL